MLTSTASLHRPQDQPQEDALVFYLPDAWQPIVGAFCARYTNPNTAYDTGKVLEYFFKHSAKAHPAQVTETDILRFCPSGNAANNTVYRRASTLRTFYRWCLRQGLTTSDPCEHLRDSDSPLRTYKKTYGRVQAKTPGRWLSHERAYGQLVTACHDGTNTGLRDELLIRLGLTGMRAAEIRSLTFANLDDLPQIRWTGKGRKPRQCTASTGLLDALRRWTAVYPDPSPTSPLIVPQRHGGHGYLAWHTPIGKTTLGTALLSRAQLAGLGHIAPHDLRRSAAGILHNAKDASGAHYFDLLDIQRVLDHSDPATTMKSYLAPMDTDVLDRAARYLD